MPKRLDTDLDMLHDFLQIRTPDLWLQYATLNIPLLLVDHAHCERKAAATAITFMSKYPERTELISIMSPLAREELLHFEKVIAILKQKNIAYCPLKPSAYATRLHKHVTARDGDERLCDQLIIGAIIEARSCERFSAMVEIIDEPPLARFYASLVKSEARHFENYLALARLYGGAIDKRLAHFLAIENEFINSNDVVFRFHSGVPVSSELDLDESKQLFELITDM